MIDLIIRNGFIIDGTGKPGYTSDIAITGNRIARIAPQITDKAESVIDAKGYILSPGFIDAHSHGELSIFNGGSIPKINQGVTTEIAGNCGLGILPVKSGRIQDLEFSKDIVGPSKKIINSVIDYFQLVKKTGILSNIGLLLTHGNIRIAAMENASCAAKDSEITKMQTLIREGIREGALGFSTGLIYAPACYADDNELLEIMKTLASEDVPFVIHLRSESDDILSELKKTLEMGIKSGVAVHISHCKVCGETNWGKSAELIDLIDSYRMNGLKVTLDQYPYLAGSTMLKTLLPQWVLGDKSCEPLKSLKDPEKKAKIMFDIENGLPNWDGIVSQVGWGNILLNSLPVSKEFEGCSIEEAARASGKEPGEFLFECLIQNDLGGTVIVKQQNENDWINIFSDPFCCIGTDGIVTDGKAHPRLYGSFPKLLAHYCRNKKIISIEKMIHKMTGLTAETFNLKNIGKIEETYYADIVIFDKESIDYAGDFLNPDCLPNGIKNVIISGEVVYESEKIIDRTPAGRIVKN